MTISFLELSDWHLQEAKVKSQKALDLAAIQYPNVSIQAKDTLALALARAGAVRAPRLLCEESVNMATDLRDPQLLTGAWLSCAEAMLDSAETQPALESALRVQESCAHFGKQDSEWRAWLIAAQASQRLGNGTAAHEYFSYARDRLSKLEQKWGLEAFNGYLTRSDISHFRKQLDESF